MKTLTLSIVIPVYNEQHYLKACLDAIANQSVKPDQVLVIDNNSTDNSVKIAKKYSFVTLIHEKTPGVLHARNKGFDHAQSEIVGRIDADTILPADWIKNVKKCMNDSSVSAITGPVYYYDMPNSPKNYWLDHKIRQWLYENASNMPFLFGSNSAIRRKSWLSIKSELCLSRNVHEDLDLAIHLNKNGQKILYEKVLVAGASSRRYDDNLGQFRKYMGMYLESYRFHGLGWIGPRIATGFYWMGYFLLAPLRRSYEEKTGKHTLKQLRKTRKSRKNPMSQ